MTYKQCRNNGEELEYQKEVKRTNQVCVFCTNFGQNGKDCFLCAEHFVCFHDAQQTTYG